MSNSVNTPPLISIIVAVFNGVNTLQQCINSVAQQTSVNKELIIVDGGSKDGTVDLLKANSEHISYWVSEPDHGIYNAWNKALAQTKGEWVCFLGADDFLWDAQVLERAARKLVTISPNICVAYGQIMLLNTRGESLFPVGESWQKMGPRFKHIMCLPHQGVMHRRSLFEKHGKFDESFRIAGDYELLLRELKTEEAFFISDLIITGMRQGGISSDSANSMALLFELRRAQRMHGLHFPGLLWLRVVGRAYIRLLLWNVLGERLAKRVFDLGRRVMGVPPFWRKI